MRPLILWGVGLGAAVLAFLSKAGARAAPSPSGGGGARRDSEGVELLDVPGLRERMTAEPEYGPKLARIVLRDLGWTQEHLDYMTALLSFESKHNPKARNPKSSASGILQWMRATAPLFGTTIEQIREMNGVQQLDYVRAYFAKRPNLTPRDLYLLVLGGRGIGKPDDFIVYPGGTDEYEKNKGVDINDDGNITNGDMRSVIDKIVFAARQKPRIVL